VVFLDIPVIVHDEKGKKSLTKLIIRDTTEFSVGNA
jgi:hypothetical protein